METNKISHNAGLLWVFLFLIIFINGFEAGGYQASLYRVGQTYDLSAMNRVSGKCFYKKSLQVHL